MEQSNGRGLPIFVVVTAAIALVQQLNAAIALYLPTLLPLRLYPVSRFALAVHFSVGALLLALGLWRASRVVTPGRRIPLFLVGLPIAVLLGAHTFAGFLFLEDLKPSYAALPIIIGLMVSSSLFSLPLISRLWFGQPQEAAPTRADFGAYKAKSMVLAVLGAIWFALFLGVVLVLAVSYQEALSNTVISGQAFDWSRLTPSKAVASVLSGKWLTAYLIFALGTILLVVGGIAVIAISIMRGSGYNRDLTDDEIAKFDAAIEEVDRYASGPVPFWYRAIVWVRRAAVVAVLLGALVLSSYAIDIVLAVFNQTRAPGLDWYLYIPVKAEITFLLGAIAALVILAIDHVQAYFWPEYRDLEARYGWSWNRSRQRMLNGVRQDLAMRVRQGKLSLDSFDPSETMRRIYRAGEFALFAAIVVLAVIAYPSLQESLSKYYLFTEGYFELPSGGETKRERIPYTSVERVEAGCAFNEEQAPNVWYAMILKDGRDFNILSASDIGSHLRYYEHIDENLTKLKVAFEPAVEEGCIEALTQEWSDAARQRVVRLLHVPPATSL